MYVSNATQSVTVAVNGGAPVATSLGATYPGCTVNGAEVDCTVPLDSPVGTDSFDVKTYDAPSGGGNELGHGSTTANVDGAPQTIPVTLNGVVKKIVISVSSANPAPCSSQSGSSLPVTVTAYDADGNIITAPGNYDNPITLIDTETSGTSSLSTTVVNGPSDSISLMVGANAQGTLSATAAGVDSSNVTAGTFNASSDPQMIDGEQLHYLDIQNPGSNPYKRQLYGTIHANSSLTLPPSINPSIFDMPPEPDGLCAISWVYDDGSGYKAYADDYYTGVAASSGAQLLLVAHDSYEDKTPYNKCVLTIQQCGSQRVYDAPYVVDQLPERPGDVWSFVPLDRWITSTYTGWNLQIDNEGSAYSSSVTNFNLANQVVWVYNIPGPPDTIATTNEGPVQVPSVCPIGAGIPSTANDLRSIDAVPNDPYPKQTDVYVVRSIGVICTAYTFPGYPPYEVYGLQAPPSVATATRRRWVSAGGFVPIFSPPDALHAARARDARS